MPQILFVMETAKGFNALPDIDGYQEFADGKVLEINHGGIVAYVENSIATSVLI